jgi:hypothetical protein
VKHGCDVREQTLALLKFCCFGGLRILRRLELQVYEILRNLKALLFAGDQIFLEQCFGLQ